MTTKEENNEWFGSVFTFAGAVEHHAGMKITGDKRSPLTNKELIKISKKFPKENVKIINIGTEHNIKDASVLIIKKGLFLIDKCNPNELWKNVLNLGEEGVDTKALMRGRVVNKRARYNFNVTDEEESSDYVNGIGTTYSFNKFKNLNMIRKFLGTLLPEDRLKNLNAESNIYHSENSGIGFHGDTERGIVIGANLGKNRRIEWHVFFKNLPVGNRICVNLEHGDLYFMTGICAGINWKLSSIPTIRHRAGYDIWLNNDEKKNIKKWDKRINKNNN